MKPRNCRTTEDLLKCRTDNFPGIGDRWSILNQEQCVSLHQPNGGGWVTIPRKDFNAIVDWYNRDQKPAKRK